MDEMYSKYLCSFCFSGQPRTTAILPPFSLHHACERSARGRSREGRASSPSEASRDLAGSRRRDSPVDENQGFSALKSPRHRVRTLRRNVARSVGFANQSAPSVTVRASCRKQAIASPTSILIRSAPRIPSTRDSAFPKKIREFVIGWVGMES